MGASALAQSSGRVGSSLLLLIDASGSMGDQVGSGNPQPKIDAAKQAAIAALGRAARTGAVEVAVLAFSGDCGDPVPRYQEFTRDVDRLTGIHRAACSPAAARRWPMRCSSRTASWSATGMPARRTG